MDLAIEDMKKNNYNSYFKKAGQKIVDLNDQAVDCLLYTSRCV